MALWRNWQTHRSQKAADKIRVGSNPTKAIDENFEIYGSEPKWFRRLFAKQLGLKSLAGSSPVTSAYLIVDNFYYL
jgi:hypothetical protein